MRARKLLATRLVATIALSPSVARADDVILSKYDEMILDSVASRQQDPQYGTRDETPADTAGVDAAYLDDGLVLPELPDNEAAAGLPQEYLPTLSIPVKNQSALGTCWAFAGVSALEQSAYSNGLAPQDSNSIPDISELSAAYFTYQDIIVDTNNRQWKKAMEHGGVTTYVADEMMAQVGPIWENGKYGGFSKKYETAGDAAAILGTYASYVSSGVFSDFYAVGQNALHVTGYYVVDRKSTSDIKYMIQQKGAGAGSIKWDLNSNMNSALDSYGRHAYHMSTDNSNGKAHAFAIVGWKDNYPASNFRQGNRPSTNGAWLVKNSWGTGSSHYDYFWVSYEAMRNFGGNVVFFDTESNGVGGTVQQVGRGSHGIPSKNASCQSEAIVLSAPRDATLDRVSVYSAGGPSGVTISVYTDLSNPVHPESGTLASTLTASKRYAGYETFSLATPVDVQEGQSYSIVITIDEDGAGTSAFVEMEETGYNTFLPALDPGQSFVKDASGDWCDTLYLSTPGSVAVKAHLASAVTASQYTGSSRYVTAANAVLDAWPNGSDGVIVVSGEAYADSLSAASLSGALGWPMLTTAAGSLPAATSSAIQQLKAGRPGFKALIVGGPNAVSDGVKGSIASLVGSGNVSRVYGTTRYDTNYEVFKYGRDRGLWGSFSILVNGSNYPDPLAASTLAAKAHAPMLFVSSSTGAPSANVKSAAATAGFTKLVVVGGPNAISDSVANQVAPSLTHDRVAGIDRFATSTAVGMWGISEGFFSYGDIGFTCGDNWVDALYAGPTQAQFSGPLYLASCTNHARNAYMVDEIRLCGTERVRWYGGTSAMRPAARNYIIDAIG